PFTRRRTEASCKLREIVCCMERFECIFPTAPRSQIVPVWNQVHDRTAGIPLAKWDTTVHATGPLSLELLFGDWFIHLLPIEHAKLDRFPLRPLAGIFHETFGIAHLFVQLRLRFRLRNTLFFLTLILPYFFTAAFFFRSSSTRL